MVNSKISEEAENKDVQLAILAVRDKHARYSHYNTSEHSNESSSNNDNSQRCEVMWEERQETLLEIWKNQINSNCITHGTKAKWNKRLYYIFAIPGVVIPVTLGLLQPHVGPEYDLMLTFFLIASTVCSGISSLFNFGKMQQEHNTLQSSYKDLNEEINYIISLKKADRTAADVTMTRIRMRMSHLDEIAPGS